MALSFQLKQKGPNAAHGKARLTKEELAEERVQLVLPAINEPLITPAELRFNLMEQVHDKKADNEDEGLRRLLRGYENAPLAIWVSWCHPLTRLLLLTSTSSEGYSFGISGPSSCLE
jgi:hypothetical protein